MTDIVAQVHKDMQASPAEVWDALTSSAKLKAFFMRADVSSDWKVGSPIKFSGEFKRNAYEDKGEIITASPQKCLSFSHWSSASGMPDTPENYHVVTFDLAARSKGTLVTLSQSKLTGGVKDSDVKHRADFEKTWQSVLDGLDKVTAA